MSGEIVKFSNQFNSIALCKFDAVHLDVLMAIASRVREKGADSVTFSFAEIRQLMQLKKNLTNRQLAEKIVETNRRLLALNYEFTDSGKIIQFSLFTRFVTDPSEETLEVRVNEEFTFLLNDLTSQFTRFELAEFTDLSSRYAKEFYRRAKQYRSTGLWQISREEFCRLLNVPKSATTQYLSNKVLKPIMEECGPLMDLQIERKYERRPGQRGRGSLCGFVFMFSSEQTPAEKAAKAKKSKREHEAAERRREMQQKEQGREEREARIAENKKTLDVERQRHGGSMFAGSPGYKLGNAPSFE